LIFWFAAMIYSGQPTTKTSLKHRGKEVAEEPKEESKRL
jgi:hypothetical protein